MHTELIFEFDIMLRITSDYFLHIVYWLFIIHTHYISWEIWIEFLTL